MKQKTYANERGMSKSFRLHFSSWDLKTAKVDVTEDFFPKAFEVF